MLLLLVDDSKLFGIAGGTLLAIGLLAAFVAASWLMAGLIKRLWHGDGRREK
ncbi:hypothetical protein [Aurantiacibacter luteus]|uniref:hypothetical protein n=1 Tax=Aurantiacibacter luteus TaxID=1581420 RepID=UPI000B0A9E82|nr:hypothetical protein [Aurantiacibacter luteus]